MRSTCRKEYCALNSNVYSLSVVIPLFNEDESLPELYQEIRKVCENRFNTYEIIFIDDGSTDHSMKVLEKLNQSDARVKVIQFRRNYGKSEALSAGFQAATGDYVVTMDADLQDDPAEIPNFIDCLEEGYDLVSGWKKHRHDPLSKRLPSKLFNKVTSLLTGIKIHDFNCGLKMYRKEVIKSVNVYGEMHRYIPVLAQWEGFRVTERVVNHRARKFGKTKFGMSRFTNGLFDLMTVMFFSKYTKRPLHLFGLLGLFSGLAGSGITLYLVLNRIINRAYLSNRPLLFVGILLLIVGVQFISIGLLGEMITRSQNETSKHAIRRKLGF